MNRTTPHHHPHSSAWHFWRFAPDPVGRALPFGRSALKKSMLLATLLLSQVAFAADEPIDVLLLGYYIWAKPEYVELCKKEGVNIHPAKSKDWTGADPANYPVEYLKQFDVVVVSGAMEKPWDATVLRLKIKPGMVDNLLEYNRQGGGVVWTPLGAGYGALDWNESTGHKIDAEALDESLDGDANKTFASVTENLRNKLSYFWSTEIEKHAVTDGVRGLFLGIDGEWGWPATIPMTFGESWQVVVHGGPETRTVTNKTPRGGEARAHTPSETTGTYESRPEIIAVRAESGERKGRMMVLPIYTTWTWGNHGHPAMKEAFLFNGDGIHPSDGQKFLMNSWRWLAEPAVAAGMGGAPLPTPAEDKAPDLSPVTWQKPEDIPWGNIHGGPWMRGLIGARSQYGGGSGTVAEWVAAAKAAGLQYLIFVDELGELTGEEYAKLIADCKAATDDTFTAIPGLGAYDTDGVYRFMPGLDRMPSPSRLTEDGKRFKQHVGVCSDSAWVTWPVMAEFGKAKYDLWWNHVISACAPLVYEKGKLVDDGVKRWWYELEKGNMRMLPLSLVRMDKPADIAEAVANAHVTVLRTGNGADIVTKIFRWGFSGQIFPSYLTSGPEIVEWICHGAASPGGGGEPYLPNSSRFRLLLKARSDAGIAKVTLTDLADGKVYRNWRPEGEKEFTVALDEKLDRLRLLALVVTDVNGRTAIAPPAYPQMMGNRVWHMGDRLMGLHHQGGWNEDHTRLIGNVGTALGLGYQKAAINECAGSFQTDHASELKFIGIEGAGVYPAELKLNANLRVDGKRILPAYRYNLALSGHDLTVLDHVGNTMLKPGAKFDFNGPPAAMEPTPYADITIRSWGLRQPYMTPVKMVVDEITFKFKQDCKPQALILGRHWGPNNDTDFNFLCIRSGADADTKAWTFSAGQKFRRKTNFTPGGYLYQAKMLAGTMGVIALDDKIMADSEARHHRYHVRPELAREFKAGDEIKVRMLLVARTFDDQQGSSEWLQQLISDYGIGTGKPGYPYEVLQGQVKEINYIFDLQAENGGAAVKIGKYPLVSTLPLRVNGIRANSVCGEYDLGTKRIRPLPVFEGSVTTSVQPSWAASHLYIGEWLTWNNAQARVSLVQDGENFQLEAHNPTDKEITVTLTGAAGFAPLAKFAKTLTIAPHHSVKEAITSAAGSVKLVPLRY
jgi:hypothetical protein